jgi:MFS family permease
VASKTFAALRNRNYRLFTVGSLVSYVGTWMQRVAQDWLVLVIGGSAGALGITTGLQFLPSLLFSPLAGVLADRIPKRRIIAVTNVAMGGTAVALGLLAVFDVAQVWHIYLLTFLFGCASAFETPSRQTIVNELVGPAELVNAVGLNSAMFNLARMIGPATAGGLIALFGNGARATGWVILLNAASYVAVLVSLWMMRASEMRPSPPIHRQKGQLGDAVRYIRGRPDIMLVLAIVFCAGTFGLNFQMTIALMATRVYHRGAGEYGLLASVIAIGSLAGSLTAARRTIVRQRLVLVATLLFGAVEVVTGLMPTYVTFGVMLAVCGVTALTTMTSANAYVQTSIHPEIRGRVMSIYMMIFVGGTPIGAPLLGWIADRFGARWTLTGGGALTVAGPLVAAAVLARRQGVSVAARWDSGPRVRVISRDRDLPTTVD